MSHKPLEPFTFGKRRDVAAAELAFSFSVREARAALVAAGAASAPDAAAAADEPPPSPFAAIELSSAPASPASQSPPTLFELAAPGADSPPSPLAAAAAAAASNDAGSEAGASDVPRPPPPFDLYISHAGDDEGVALLFARRCEQRNVKVWLAHDQLRTAPGERPDRARDLARSLLAIEQCAAIAALVTEAYVQSHVCQRDFARAGELRLALIPVAMLESLWPPTKFSNRLSGRPFLDAREGRDFSELDLDRALQAAGVYPERARSYAVRLITACVERREKDALLALAEGADVNLVVAGGFTPLTVACAHGLAKIAEAITCTRGVRLNAATAGGDTALTFACARGMGGMAALLVLRGADVNAATRGGRTALDLAREQGLAGAEKALLAKKAISGEEVRARRAAAAERLAQREAAAELARRREAEFQALMAAAAATLEEAPPAGAEGAAAKGAGKEGAAAECSADAGAQSVAT